MTAAFVVVWVCGWLATLLFAHERDEMPAPGKSRASNLFFAAMGLIVWPGVVVLLSFIGAALWLSEVERG